MPDIMELAMEGKYSCEEASREVVADAMADILPDSHFVENLYQKNQNLFERVLNKLKEFVKNVREYFAHVNPNTKLEAAVLKENTESGMRYLEKIVEAFDKTAEAAVENYQQAANVTESTAEGRTQYKTRGKYWRPDLKGNEWQLLERRMGEEIGSRENFLDEATKWVYANEKGVQVFALYGIGNGTEATPLYAVGGKQAVKEAKNINVYMEGSNNDGSTVDFERWLEARRHSRMGQGGSVLQSGRGGRNGDENGRIHSGQQERNAGGAAERSSEDQRGVKEKFSLRDSTGRELTEAQQAYFKDSKVRDADGNLLVMYHQTDGTFTVFDTKHKGAGAGDDETPFGIFLKRTPRNIGVRGEKQMELYADIRNPLRVRDRTELVSKLRELSADYARLKDESAQIDKEYGAKFEEAKNAFKSFLIQWRKNNPDAPPRAAYDADGFDAAFNEEDNVVKEWTRAKDELTLRAKTSITQALRDNGYDGVILENDKGSWGRSTDAYIALDANQVKNTTNKTPTADPDIRYSLREIGGKVMPVLDVQNDTRDYKVAEAYLKTLVDTEHPFATILMDAQPVYIGKDLPGEYKGSEYTHGLNSSTRQVKMQAATNLDEMLLLAENGEWRDNVKEKHKQDAKNGWYRYSTRFALPVLDIKKAVDHYTVYSGTLLIRNDADGKSYLYDLLDIKKEKVISSPSFSARERSEVFEPKPSQEQYMQNSRESQAENTGNDRHALRDVAMSDRDVLRRAADLALNDRKMNFTQADRERLKIFKKRLDILDEKQTQRQGYLQTKRDILSNSARLF